MVGVIIHACLFAGRGSVYVTGRNTEGQLGLGHCNDTRLFQQMPPFCHPAPLKMLSAGCNTSAALTGQKRGEQFFIAPVDHRSAVFLPPQNQCVSTKTIALLSPAFHHRLHVVPGRGRTGVCVGGQLGGPDRAGRGELRPGAQGAVCGPTGDMGVMW